MKFYCRGKIIPNPTIIGGKGNGRNRALRLREGCGQELTAIISRACGNGKVALIKCPKCGNVSRILKG